MSHSRPRSRSRSGPRGNPSPSGDAAETAAEAALVSAAVAVDGLVLYRGDPQQLVAQRTYVDFYFHRTGSPASYLTIQHKGCEVFKHTGGRANRTTYEAGGRAGVFSKIQVNFILFSITEYEDGPIEFFLVEPRDPVLRNRKSIKITLANFRLEFQKFRIGTAEDVVVRLKEELGD